MTLVRLQKASSGAAMATKPGVVTASTGSGAAAGGSVSVGTAGKVTPKGSTEVDGLCTPESECQRGGLLAVWV